jgi:minor extracellular serine protease Vpr
MPCILGVVMGLGVCAQTPVLTPRKCDVLLTQKRLTAKVQLISVIIKCTDSHAVADEITRSGYHATVINSTIVTARVPSSYVSTLSAESKVSFIQAARQMFGKTVDARAATGVDKIQSGEGLETPYTGKGVIVGVIDQGFEFRHIGFLNKNSQPRVVAVWNRKGYSKGTDSAPTTDIPANGDGINIEGHATHVTNIAAGSKIAENSYYGMAPEADIIMIPSEFDESEIVEDVKYINDFAAKKGEPWVINMSFGTQLGAHDGTSYFGQAVDSLITSGVGHQICVAASNEGASKIHASHVFTSDKDTVSVLVSPGYYGSLLNIWCQSTDSMSHLKIRPFIYSDGVKNYEDSAFWVNCRGDQIAPFNRKQNCMIYVSSSYGSYISLGADIIGNAGTSFHAWTNAYYGEFVDSPSAGYISGDHLYSINEMAADITHCVTVGAYVTNDTYTNTSGSTLNGGFGTLGSLCSFSCSGPALGSVPKPTVTAPGSVIKSAVSKYGVGFEKSGSYIVQDVKRGIKHFYYGAMSGTSMATPVVTGIVALWLQANPNLTAEQISDIMRTTAKHDSFTGNDEWNSSWGYGKIDAYEGLKAALKLIDPTDVKEYTLSSPVTLSKDNDEWRILFNTAETSADISVSDIAGVTVLSHHIANAACGQEEKVSFSSMKHGVYIIRISTPHGTIVRKVII